MNQTDSRKPTKVVVRRLEKLQTTDTATATATIIVCRNDLCS
jgi:hypothetical protein